MIPIKRLALPVIAIAALLSAAPGAAAEPATLTIDPATVTISSEHGASQTVHNEGERDATIVFRFEPSGPPGFTPRYHTYRRQADNYCQRVTSTDYLCEGYGDLVLTYPAIPDGALAEAASYSLRVWTHSQYRNVEATVIADIPAPSIEPSQAPSVEASLQPSPEPSPSTAGTEPPSSPTASNTGLSPAPPTADPNGGGLNLQAVGVFGSVGAVTIAAGFAALLLRRRRDDGEPR